MKYLLPFVLLFALASCTHPAYDDKCTRQDYAAINSATGSRSGSVNNPIPFTVNYTSGWACCEAGPFETRVDGNRIYIDATVYSQICTACIATTTSFTSTFYFTPDKPGMYYLYFHQANGDYVTDTLAVN